MSIEAQTLAEQHHHLVGQVVSHMLRRRRMPSFVDRDELESAAAIALVRAAARYRSDGGASFTTYAWRRMKGAVIDEIRSSAPLSRDDWRKYLAGDESVARFTVSFDEHLLEIDTKTTSAPGDDELLQPDFEQSALRAHLRDLPARLEKVLLLYYRDSLTMKEIGALIGVNESRVSQLHTTALRRLRAIVSQDSWAN